MKLYEIKRIAPVDADGFLTDPADIRKAAISLKLNPAKIHNIDEHGVMNYNGDVIIDGARKSEAGKLTQLPFKFGEVTGLFRLCNHNITSMKGCPRKVNRFSVYDNKLTSIEYLPEHAESISVSEKGITSLVGVGNIVKFCKEFTCTFDSVLGEITEGGLGLLSIDGLEKLVGYNKFANKSPWVTIAKYLGRPEDIFECQTELIENGYEAYAEA